MQVVLVVFLILGVNFAQSAMPMVQQVQCKEQDWPDNQVSTSWNYKHGNELLHEGFDESEKGGSVKIADFFMTLKGMNGKEAAIFCTANIQGGVINAVWLSKAGDDVSSNHIFGGVGQSQLRFGVVGREKGENLLKTRVELYGKKKPTGATVTCAAGPEGKTCPPGLTIEIRMQEDQS